MAKAKIKSDREADVEFRSIAKELIDLADYIQHQSPKLQERLLGLAYMLDTIYKELKRK